MKAADHVAGTARFATLSIPLATPLAAIRHG
jgi:hypothetical protein